MASIADIAALITQGLNPPTDNSDLSFHTGVIQSWDELTGVNTVLLNGVSLTNLKVINSGLGVGYTVGDVVAVQRFQSTYFIAGKIQAPGGSAAMKIVSANIGSYHNVSSPLYPTFGNLPTVGPTVTTTIGSSRRCIVLFGMRTWTNKTYGLMSFDVTGASSIAANAWPGMTVSASTEVFGLGAGSVTTGQTPMGCAFLTAAHGLNPGQNTFTAKYSVDTSPGGTGAEFDQRNLTVIPL